MKRFIIDIALWALMVVCMSFHTFPRGTHEVIGTALFIVTVVHVFINGKWFGALTKGRWSDARIMWTLMSIALVISFMVAFFTGAIISTTVFKPIVASLPLHRSTLIHQLHVLSAYTTLILAGLHIGCHWAALWARITGLIPPLSIFTRSSGLRVAVVVAIACMGVIASRLAAVGDRLMMRHIFGTPLTMLPTPAEPAGMMLIMALYAVAAWVIMKFIQK